MLRPFIAERLLAFFTTRERASVIVGDLLELHCGRTAFWLAVLRTVWDFSWRFGLGFLLAMAAEFYSIFVLITWASRPPHGVDSIAIFSGWCFALVVTSAVFSSIRFGILHVMSVLSTALVLVVSLDLFLWWIPFVRLTSAALMLLVLVLSCLTSQGRLALRRLLSAIVAAALPLIVMAYIITRATAERCRLGYNLSFQNAPIVVLVPIAFVLSSGIIAGVLGRHKVGRAHLS